MDKGPGGKERVDGAAPADQSDLVNAGKMISVTRTVPLSALTAPSGSLSLARLRHIVHDLKAGHTELADMELGDLELRRHGPNVEVRVYFLPGTCRSGEEPVTGRP